MAFIRAFAVRSTRRGLNRDLSCLGPPQQAQLISIVIHLQRATAIYRQPEGKTGNLSQYRGQCVNETDLLAAACNGCNEAFTQL